MRFVIYMQCDARFCEYLLKPIGDVTVVETTINRIKALGDYEIISSVYDCAENDRLLGILSRQGVKCEKSTEENVTIRFINSIKNLNDIDAVIRVCGDQALLNVEISKKIIESFNEFDYFYISGGKGSILPDIARIELLMKKERDIIASNRYFDVLLNDTSLKRMPFVVDNVFNICRTKDYLSYIFCKNVIENGLDVYALQNNLMNAIGANSYFYNAGMLNSWLLADSRTELFYDVNGDCNPWWCESAVNLVKSKIQEKKIDVFEWGSGNSTLFWSKYAQSVVSIEYNEEWYNKIQNLVSKNVVVRLINLEYDGDYCKAILDESKKFDVILIDGRDRVQCAKNCVERIKSDGIIIWDNSEREYYKEGFEYLLSKGFKRLELSGIIWGLPGQVDYTSIFYRQDNQWGL